LTVAGKSVRHVDDARIDKTPPPHNASISVSMRTPTANRKLVEQSVDPTDALEYICIAADLLQRMFTELCALAANDADLERALSCSTSGTRDRLRRLQEAVDVLVTYHDPATHFSLMRRTTTLISWLWSEIDELAFLAAGEERGLDQSSASVH
jgi:hypothetical protein